MRIDHSRFTEMRVFVTEDGKHHDTPEMASTHAQQMARLAAVEALVAVMAADSETVEEDDRGSLCWYRADLVRALLKHAEAVLGALGDGDDDDYY